MEVISNGLQIELFIYYIVVVSTSIYITVDRSKSYALHSNWESDYHCHDNKRALTTEQNCDSVISIGSQELF